MRSERGFAMIWAMLLVIAVGSTTALLVLRGRTVRQEAATDVLRDGSFHAAEGGLAHARHELARHPEFEGSTIEIGEFRVTSAVERVAGGFRRGIRRLCSGRRLRSIAAQASRGRRARR